MDSLSEYILVVVVEEMGNAETEGCEYTLVRDREIKNSIGTNQECGWKRSPRSCGGR